MIRGLAALAVCAGHLRAFLWVDFSDLKTRPFGSAPAYFLTGLGHQAVMVFFVLSGFFIGGSVMATWRSGRWSWRIYALQRMSRLWVVLVPALLLTVMWDLSGHGLTGGHGYDGSYRDLIHSGPSEQQPLDLSPRALLGNLFFLQTILVPAYGTNGPLWSLANEFWYYVIFPLIWVSTFGKNCWRWLCGLVVVVTLWCLPGVLLGGFLIWLFGAFAYLFGRIRPFSDWLVHKLWIGSATLLFITSLILSRYGHWLGSDYLLGGTFALLLPGLAANGWSNKGYQRVAAALSDFSYTLYATHFPVLAFLFFVFLAPTKRPFGWEGIGLFGVCLVGVIAYAKLVWWCFERNTNRIRRWVEAHLLSGTGKSEQRAV
jgi:peptidoglycan/LPS O-acetylase OafA/YrhL